MKNSGIEWIGDIPEHWEIIRFKNTHAGTNVGEAIDKTYWTSIISDRVFYTAGLYPINTNYEQFPERKYTQKNDLLLARNGTPYVYLPPQDALYSDHIIRAKIKANFDKLYIRYCLEQSISFEIFDTVSLTTWSASIWNEQVLPLPPFPEQQKIADYLDGKCAKIDNLISHEEATIEELKVYKQSVITELVTKGLDKSVPMKDSGVVWIGNIPAHWIADRLKNILSERNEKNDPIKTTERLSLSIDLGVTLYADKTTNLDRFKDDFTQYKIAYPNDLVLNSMNMIVGAVGVSSFYGCVSPAYYVLYSKAKKGYMSKYFYYLFKTKSMNRYLYSIGKGIYAIERGDDRVNTCRLKISRDDLNNLILPIPPENEMLRIIKKVEETKIAVDNLIRAKQQKIEELKEYKKSLIYEYVTGKKEVG